MLGAGVLCSSFHVGAGRSGSSILVVRLRPCYQSRFFEWGKTRSATNLDFSFVFVRGAWFEFGPLQAENGCYHISDLVHFKKAGTVRAAVKLKAPPVYQGRGGFETPPFSFQRPQQGARRSPFVEYLPRPSTSQPSSASPSPPPSPPRCTSTLPRPGRWGRSLHCGARWPWTLPLVASRMSRQWTRQRSTSS